MNVHTQPGPTREFEQFLEDLEAELEIPPSRYEAAETSYRSVGDWLGRPQSKLQPYDPTVYSQGSFRLGTAIKPLNLSDEYDVDAICEVRLLEKSRITQARLKELLGEELALYVADRGMKKPATDRPRCWTLHYADEAQFHLDVTPAIPQSQSGRRLLAAAGVPLAFLQTAIAITDKDHDDFRLISEDWPRSNPKAYCEWFRSRMAIVLARRKATMGRTRAEVEAIPDYKIRTPLQSAIKLLKRHRDIMFSGNPTDAPISIIITTLAAHAYQGEETVTAALLRLLSDMRAYILPDHRSGNLLIRYPTDPGENFADKWQKHPERADAFFEWLDRARQDFASVYKSSDRREIARVMSRSFGSVPVERILRRRPILSGNLPIRVRDFARDILFGASHRRRPQWVDRPAGAVRIMEATFSRNGFRAEVIASDGHPLEKGGSLRFVAQTTVPAPYKVYWQIVNSGEEAERAANLRGRFEYVEKGTLTRQETTEYSGPHSIECFIVKNGGLAARSQPFIVNIR